MTPLLLLPLCRMPELDFINAIGGINPLFTEPLPLSFAEKPLFDPTPFNYTLPDDWIWCMLDQRYTGEFLTPVDMKGTSELATGAPPHEMARTVTAS